MPNILKTYTKTKQPQRIRKKHRQNNKTTKKTDNKHYKMHKRFL